MAEVAADAQGLGRDLVPGLDLALAQFAQEAGAEASLLNEAEAHRPIRLLEVVAVIAHAPSRSQSHDLARVHATLVRDRVLALFLNRPFFSAANAKM